MPHFNFFTAWGLQALEGDQADESGGVEGRVKDPVCIHGLDEAASWLVHACLAVICLCEDFNQALLVRWSYFFVLSPPVVRVLQELLKGFLVILFF